MTYSTIAGVKRKLRENLYDEDTIDAIITATDTDVVAFVNSALRRTTDFTEVELTTTAEDIRLASDCYCAYRVMSETLEGVSYDDRALADIRLKESREILTMYCANIGIIPAFDLVVADSCVVDYAYAVATDDSAIG